MSGFTYVDGVLHADGVSLERIAAEVGTPCYVYAQSVVTEAYDRFSRVLSDTLAPRPAPLICYALKANPNLAVIRALAARGAGADVVSEGEIRRALAVGVPPEKIVFAGVGKTRTEMSFALEQGIHQFNVESLPEMDALDASARDLGRVAPVALRVNPDVDAGTHDKISTGRAGDKFGIDVKDLPDVLDRLAALPHLSLKGLAIHIGSQVGDLAPFRAAFTRIAEIYRGLRTEGWPVSRLDLGGGLGIVYRDEALPDLGAYARLVAETVGDLGAELTFEPGRQLVGNAGVLVTRTIYVKQGRVRPFVVIDAGMNDLIRPALYDAWHEIVPICAPGGDAEAIEVDVVGPVCETGDTFAQARSLYPVSEADLLAFRSAGAYGATMSSTYNSRLPAPEVLVNGEDYAVIRPRPSHEAMMAAESMPSWLAMPARDTARRTG